MQYTEWGLLSALVVGLIASPFIFSDLGPEESLTKRITITAIIFFVGGAISGVLSSNNWITASLCAWSPIGMGLFMLISKLLAHGDYPYWSAICTFLFIPVTVASIGGFVGSRLSRYVYSRSG